MIFIDCKLNSAVLQEVIFRTSLYFKINCEILLGIVILNAMIYHCFRILNNNTIPARYSFIYYFIMYIYVTLMAFTLYHLCVFLSYEFIIVLWTQKRNLLTWLIKWYSKWTIHILYYTTYLPIYSVQSNIVIYCTKAKRTTLQIIL